MAIDVTVFTGFLGAGKTTIILNAIKKLAGVDGYSVVLLKNEFGDVEVDSVLAQDQSIKVTEMLNGCLCCVLVGQMKNALEDIKEKYSPHRIIIESSGSAFPAPIAWQIRQLEPDFKLDSIITVIDCVNFTGYEDTSYTAKMQAAYTDVILLNKHELCTERQLDQVLDHVYELNEDTPKVKYIRDEGVDLELLFGLDTQLFRTMADNAAADAQLSAYDPDHHAREVDIITVSRERAATPASAVDEGYDLASLEQFLGSLSKDNVYRVKGFVRDKSDGSYAIVNHAFGRCTLSRIETDSIAQRYSSQLCLLTVMGVGLDAYVKQLQEWFGVDRVDLHRAH
ncbi:hypothetical protein RI367_000819 [Sorochytrium milnesiophthora]